MVLQIILLVLITLILFLVIMFLFYVLFPSIVQKGLPDVDAIISDKEMNNEIDNFEEVVVSKEKAIVLCNPSKTFDNERIKLNSMHSCKMVKSVLGTGTDCKFACIGLGDCAKVCPQKAIYFENKTAKVSQLCIGCGKCVDVCPNNIIKLIPNDTKEIVMCSNCLEGQNTTCSCKQKSEKVERILKKDFKMWLHCYRIVETLKKIFK